MKYHSVVIIMGQKSWYGTCWYDTTPHPIYYIPIGSYLTLCPRSLVYFYIAGHYIELDKASYTYSAHEEKNRRINVHQILITK